MKPYLAGTAELAGESPPARGRGLKPKWLRPAIGVSDVAPRAGAWIETAC